MDWFAVAESDGSYRSDIRERTFAFALRIVKMIRAIEKAERYRSDSSSTLRRQLLRSATSVGANLEEAKGAESQADFLHKLRVALKEARETHYWLRLLRAADFVEEKNTDDLLDESDQIIGILTSIIVNTQNRK